MGSGGGVRDGCRDVAKAGVTGRAKALLIWWLMLRTGGLWTDWESGERYLFYPGQQKSTNYP